jgi:hypothetical protein
MAGAQGLARLQQTPWLPPAERAALERLRDAYARYGGLPLPAREALLADTARVADRHAHFLREGAWPAAGSAGATGKREQRPPSPPAQPQQPTLRPGTVLRRRAALPHATSPPRRQATTSSVPTRTPPMPPPMPTPLPCAPAAAVVGEEHEPLLSSPSPSSSFAAALDQLLPDGEEAGPAAVAAVQEGEDDFDEEPAMMALGQAEEEEVVEAATAAAAEAPPPPPAPSADLPPLPFRAPPSHPAQRRLQRRSSTSSLLPDHPSPAAAAAPAPLFEPLLSGGDHGAAPSPPGAEAAIASPSPAAPSPATPASPSPSIGTVDLGAAWRLYWPAPPLERWRELDAARAAAVAAPHASCPPGSHWEEDDEELSLSSPAAVRARPMLPTESLGPDLHREEEEEEAGSAGRSKVAAAAAAAHAAPASASSPTSSSLKALFDEMCAPGGAPDLGTFVEEAPILPLAPVELLLGGADEEEEAMLLRDDGGGGGGGASSSSSSAPPPADAFGSTIPPPPAERHLVWRPSQAAVLATATMADLDDLVGRGRHHSAPHYNDDDHAAWRAFVESAVAWRRRDDADARALRALSRSPDEDQQRTPDWHAARGSRLTASAFCNAVGWFGRYPATRLLDAQRLWREKVGLEAPPPPNAAMRRGTALEPLAQRAYARLVAQARGGKVEPCSFKTWAVGPAHDWLSASPDGLVQQFGGGLEGGVGGGAAAAAGLQTAAFCSQQQQQDQQDQHHQDQQQQQQQQQLLVPLPPALALANGPGILEIKCPSKELSAVGGPGAHVRRLDYYAMQVQGQLEFSGREWAHLYLWTPSSGSAAALVKRDRDYWRVLWQVLADFWWGHVAPARVLRREGAPDGDVLAYMPRREHPWSGELRARSREMLRRAEVVAFGSEETEAAAAAAAMEAAMAEAAEEDGAGGGVATV